MITITKIASLYILFFISVNVSAQPHGKPGGKPEGSGTVFGKVLEEDSKKPVEYTNVALYKLPDSTLVTGTITNSNGGFEIKNVPFGKYYIVVDFLGFKSQLINSIHLSKQSDIYHVPDITLKQSSIQVDEVYVVSDQAQVDYQIDKKVVTVGKDFVSSSGTIADVLENVPSIQVDIEGNVSLRGSTSFTVLIDGRPSILDGNDALQQLSSSEVQSVEIITNPSAKYDPEGTAGIINVITKNEKRNGFNGVIDASIGMNDKIRGDILLNYKFDNIKFYTGLNYRDDNFHGTSLNKRYTENDTTITEGERGMHRGGNGIKVGADWYVSPKTTIGISARTGKFEFGFFGEENESVSYPNRNTTNYYIKDAPFTRERNYYAGGFNLTQILSSSEHKIQANFQYSYDSGESPDITTIWNTDENYSYKGTISSQTYKSEYSSENDYEFKIDYSQPVWGKGKLEAGAEGEFEYETEKYKYSDSIDVSNNWLFNSNLSTEMESKINTAAAYTTLQYNFSNFGIQGGLRAEITNRKIIDTKANDEYPIERLDFFPTLHSSYQLAGNNQLQLSYSKRMQRPRSWYLEPFYVIQGPKEHSQGNPLLEPEFTHSVEFGWQKRWQGSFIALESFYRYTENKITRDTKLIQDSVQFNTFKNLNSEESSGLELMINLIHKNWLTVNSSASGYYYRFFGDSASENSNNDGLTWDTRFNSTFRPTKNLRIQFNAFYRAPRNTSQGTREGSLRTDAAIRYNWLDGKLSTTLQIRDIFATGRWEGETINDDLYVYYKRQREPQIITLSISYRFNDYKPEREGRGGNGGGDFDGGGEGF